MVIGICRVTLTIHSADSLKAKRSVLKSLIARLRQDFNISIAEVDANDLWQSAVLGMACVSNDQAHAHEMLERAVSRLEGLAPEAELVDYEIEMV
ncbi:MAG: DUF503 domain-containing protein [Chloroflexi bacterium]|nr:DUF503 domain-containing protein [Chloroflexota bacterium]